jgi:nicotinate-nucleotide pyrophosphorylase (carboxylating)
VNEDDWLHPPHHAVAEAVARALAEDLDPLGDLTGTLLGDQRTEARITARRPGRLAGTRCASAAFAQVDPAVEVVWSCREGGPVESGDVLGVVRGPLRSIVTAERTALNFLGFLSGIATRTAEYVAAAEAGGPARIWDTRKTVPGTRALSKAAVRAGGGRNHRGNLSDWLMLKDNHLSELGITAAVATARDRWPGRTIHVECDRLEQCVEALAAGADAVLLDNMSPDEVRACVAAARELQGDGPRRTLLEVSGGITLDNVASYAGTGVDMISAGALTNAAGVLDVGLDIGPVAADGGALRPGVDPDGS